MTVLAGIDIGGTKCAVSIGRLQEDRIELLGKRRFPTPPDPALTISQLLVELDLLADEVGVDRISAIGISCGGPLDSRTGRILSPPNLPNWDAVNIVAPFKERFGVPVGLQNDANAGALAEWQWGAGRGLEHIVFLTFGTGMGAGMILNGRLYSGTNDMAGEVGHIRLDQHGPIGYGKLGSFEGYCSGGGIAQLARTYAENAISSGVIPRYCPVPDQLSGITAEQVGIAAQAGDATAIAVFTEVGRRLGQGLAILIDMLNPQRIIIGSIFGRQEALLRPFVMQVLQEEALSHSLSVCEIVPAGLGEQIGDYASLSVALHTLKT